MTTSNTNDDFDSSKDRFEKAADDFSNQAEKAAKEIREEWNEITHSQENKKVLCGVLGILLGSLGIHKFILGYTTEGIIQILLNLLCGLGGIIGLIEGIIYLTKTDEEFYQTYQVNKKGWF